LSDPFYRGAHCLFDTGICNYVRGLDAII